MTETKTALVAWNGETYKGAGDWYDEFVNNPEFLEFTEDLNFDELLRLAMFAYNGAWGLVPEDLPLFIAQEQEAFWGEWDTGAEFALHCAETLETRLETLPDWIVIDWQMSWDANLSHDFFSYQVIDIDGNFRQFFWRSE